MKNTRLLYGILSIVLAAIVAFIAVPAVTRQANTKVQIVRVVNSLERGQQIESKDVELTEVGGYNLPTGIATRLSDVVGTYAAAELFPGDYILPLKVSAAPLSSDPSLNQIPDGMLAISVSTKTLATGLSDKLQAGDIIRFYHYNDNPEALIKVEEIIELSFLYILSVTDPDGLPVDYTKEPAADEERQNTATITVLATPEQAVLLTQYENEGVLHAALICRGNEELAEELLERQSEILTGMYGSGGLLENPDDLDAFWDDTTEFDIGTYPMESEEPGTVPDSRESGTEAPNTENISDKEG